MAKVDKIKEILGTLRMLFGMAIVVLIAIGGGLMAMFNRDLFNFFFWLGLLIEIIIFVSAVVISFKIGKYINHIEKV